MNDVERTLGTNRVRFPLYEFLVLFLPVAILALIVGFSFVSMRTDARIESIMDSDGSRLQQISGFIGAQLSGSLNHLVAITEEQVTKQALDSNGGAAWQPLRASFLTLARRNPSYAQVRWIDETGFERVRISQRDGTPEVVPEQMLQDKSRRYYVAATRDLLRGEIYISPIDLNVEHGRIERPFQPVLRVATPVFDSHRKSRGVIVLNVAMRHMFDAIEGLGKLDPGSRYFLVNHEGQVLNLPDDEPSQATELSGEFDFRTANPHVWARVRQARTGSLEAQSGLWTWAKLAPADMFSSMRQVLPGEGARVDRLVSDGFELTLLAHRPMSFLVDLRRDSRMLASLGIMLGVAVYGLSVFLYLNGHVRARRAELHTGLAIARAEHIERIRDLEERSKRLFEVSNIGQMVVNDQGLIELANSSVEKLLGYRPGELNGVAVDSLLPESLREHHQKLRGDYFKSPEARLMGEGRRLQALTAAGEGIPVEVGLNPYTDNGRVLVLVSIVDLSGRVERGGAHSDH
ncbi:MAG: PAS domain S-box protein [Gammaproteobacteria bacterium]|nr:PAS domain S-box protein [Gammaproteobacteria bacterium]